MPTETVNRVTEFRLIANRTPDKSAGFYLLPHIKTKATGMNFTQTMPESSKDSDFVIPEKTVALGEGTLSFSFVEQASSVSAILYKLGDKDSEFYPQAPAATVSELAFYGSGVELPTAMKGTLYKLSEKQSAFVTQAPSVAMGTVNVDVISLHVASNLQAILIKASAKTSGFFILPADKQLVDFEIDAELLLRKMKFLPVLHYGASHQTQELTEGVSKIYYMGLDGISQLSVAKWYPVLLGETTTYSFERYLTLDCVYKGVSEEAYDFRMWADLDKDASIDLYYGFNTTYSAPKGTKSLIATIKIPESREAAVTIPINTPTERLKHPGDKTMYVVTQVAVKPDAVGGLTGTLHIIWKEIM